MLSLSLKERREALRGAFQEIPGQYQYATHKELEDTDDLAPLLQEVRPALSIRVAKQCVTHCTWQPTQAVEAQCEGLMVKTWDVNATYEPGTRTYKWIKVRDIERWQRSRVPLVRVVD